MIFPSSVGSGAPSAMSISLLNVVPRPRPLAEALQTAYLGFLYPRNSIQAFLNGGLDQPAPALFVIRDRRLRN